MTHVKNQKVRNTIQMANSEGKLVKVKVRAGSRKESLTRKEKGILEICVKEPAEGNRANARVIELVARYLGTPAKRVRIVTGHRSPGKTLRIS